MTNSETNAISDDLESQIWWFAVQMVLSGEWFVPNKDMEVASMNNQKRNNSLVLYHTSKR